MSKVAIPIKNHRLSDDFRQCDYVSIVDYDKDQRLRARIALPCDPAMGVEQIMRLGVSDLIVYKIDYALLQAFEAHKVNVFVGIERRGLEQIMSDYLEGKIYSDNRMIEEIIKGL